MMSKNETVWQCPFCNALLPMTQEVCPFCSEDNQEEEHESYMDGIDIPFLDESEYRESVEREFGKKRALTFSWRTLVAVILLILFALSLVLR